MALTVAVDGPAASGKGTISRAVAEHFGFAHLDTGLLYRAVGVAMLSGSDPLEAALNLQAADIDGDRLRTAEVAQAASKAAAIPEVREALLDFQRAFARRAGGAVLDGRDIGTVICPEAEVKLYVTASDEVRAKRRFLELSEKGHDVTPEGIAEDLATRDRRDSERAIAPLKPAEDAVIVDTSDLGISDAIALAVAAIDAAQT